MHLNAPDFPEILTDPVRLPEPLKNMPKIEERLLAEDSLNLRPDDGDKHPAYQVLALGGRFHGQRQLQVEQSEAEEASGGIWWHRPDEDERREVVAGVQN